MIVKEEYLNKILGLSRTDIKLDKDYFKAITIFQAHTLIRDFNNLYEFLFSIRNDTFNYYKDITVDESRELITNFNKKKTITLSGYGKYNVKFNSNVIYAEINIVPSKKSNNYYKKENTFYGPVLVKGDISFGWLMPKSPIPNDGYKEIGYRLNGTQGRMLRINNMMLIMQYIDRKYGISDYKYHYSDWYDKFLELVFADLKRENISCNRLNNIIELNIDDCIILLNKCIKFVENGFVFEESDGWN